MKKMVYLWHKCSIYSKRYLFSCGCEVCIKESECWSDYIQEEGGKQEIAEQYMLDYYEDHKDEYELEYLDDSYVNEELYTEKCECKCMECQLREEYKTPCGNGWFVSHGIAAYCKEGNIGEMVINRTTDIINHPEWQLCASSIKNNIGPVGLWGHSDIDISFKHDVWSVIADDGRRHIIGRDSAWNEFINNGYTIPEQMEYRMLINRKDEGKDGHDHCEHWVKNFKPTHFWVKKWLWDESKPEAKEAYRIWAKHNKLKLILVDDQGSVGMVKVG